MIVSQAKCQIVFGSMIQYLDMSKRSDPVLFSMRIHEKANQHRNAFCESQIDINSINKRVFQLIGELSNSIAELSNSIEERSN